MTGFGPSISKIEGGGIVDNELQLRIELGRRVAQMLTQTEALGSLPAVSDGNRNVIIALTDERCGDIFRKVEEVGGRANVVTGTPDALTIIAFTPDSDLFAESFPAIPIGPDSQLGLLVAFLREQRGPTRVNLEEPALSAELVEPDDQEPIPVS